MWEQAARYHYVYGLNPFGSHRSLADRLLALRRESCTKCAGQGVLDVSKGIDWHDCPVCEGTGSVWNCSHEEVDALIRLITRLSADSRLV
jgi:RecJ-like exonuclease